MIKRIMEEELHAYLDGELPDARRAAVEAYLREHPDDARRLEAYRADGKAIGRIFSRAGAALPGRRPSPGKFMAVPPVAAGSCCGTDSCGGGRCWLVRS